MALSAEEPPSTTSITTAVLVPIGFDASFDLNQAIDAAFNGMVDSGDAALTLHLRSHKMFRLRHSHLTWHHMVGADRSIDLIVLRPNIKRTELIFEQMNRADVVVFLSPADIDTVHFTQQYAPGLHVRFPQVLAIVDPTVTPPKSAVAVKASVPSPPVDAAAAAAATTPCETTDTPPSFAAHLAAKCRNPHTVVPLPGAAGGGVDGFVAAAAPILARELLGRLAQPASAACSDPRAQLPLRLDLVSRMTNLRVNHFFVLQGTLRVGDRIASSVDVLATAVDDGGNEVVSMRVFPDNVPVTVALPGMHVGVCCRSDVDAASDKSRTSIFDPVSKEAVFGHATPELLPLLPQLLHLEDCDEVGEGVELRLIGLGGVAKARVLRSTASRRVVLVEDACLTLCADFCSAPHAPAAAAAGASNDTRVTTPPPQPDVGEASPPPQYTNVIVSYTYYVMNEKTYTQTPHEAFRTARVAVRKSLMKLALHLRAARILQLQTAAAQPTASDAVKTKAETDIKSFIGNVCMYYAMRDEASALERWRSLITGKGNLKRIVAFQANELLCDVAGIQHSLGLNPNRDRRFPRFSLLTMIGMLKPLRGFGAALERLPVKAAAGMIVDPADITVFTNSEVCFNSGATYLRGNPSASGVASKSGRPPSTEDLTVHMVAASCIGDQQLRFVEGWLANCGASSRGVGVAKMLIDSFITVGCAIPVLRFLCVPTTPVTSEILFRLASSTGIPPFVFLWTVLQKDLPKDVKIDALLKHAAPGSPMSKALLRYNLAASQGLPGAILKGAGASSLHSVVLAYVLQHAVATAEYLRRLPPAAVCRIMEYLSG